MLVLSLIGGIYNMDFCSDKYKNYSWQHIVFFKFNEKSTNEYEQCLLNLLLSFKKTIPGIVELTAAFNETDELDRIQGFRLGLQIIFENKQSLIAYATNSNHLYFQEQLAPVFENAIVVDYPLKYEKKCRSN